MTWCVRTVAQSVFAPIICHSPYVTPLFIPLPGRRIQQRYMSSFFLEVYSFFSIYLFLIAILANYSNPTQCLKNFSSRYRCLQIAFFSFYLLISLVTLSTLLLSVLFVDKSPSVYAKKAVCSFCMTVCTNNMAIGSVSAPMWLPISLVLSFFIVYLLSYSGFSNLWQPPPPALFPS